MSGAVGIYVRVSRKGDREDERFHSPREQAERAATLARAKGYAVGPTFEDIDVSGATRPEDRPAMAELLREIEAGRLAGIAAYSLDRLSRDPAHGDALVKAVTKAGGVLLTPDMPEAIDTPTGEFTFGMLLQVAKLYRSTAGARFASAKAHSILEGIPVSVAPVGYRQRADRRLELDPALAPVIREMFERRARGAGYTELANLLTEASGRTWSLPGVRGIIRNRLYATGRVTLGDVVSEWDAGVIVDEPLWHAAQNQTNGLRPKREADSPWLLTGIARCDACGHSLAGWTGGVRRRRGGTGPGRMDWVAIPVERRPRRYRCPNRKCHVGTNVEARRLEQYVYEMSARLGQELAARSDAPDLAPLEEALVAAERRLAQVLEPEAQDALGDAWASTAKARRQERDAAATALGEARASDGGPGALDFRLEDVWDGLSNDDRRAMLSLFWREVRVGVKERPKSRGPVPLRFIARGPHGEAEVTLPGAEDETTKGPG